MMTLDEAIEHAEWCAENSCGECAEEHKQLAEWLRELVTLKDEHARLRSMLQESVNMQLEDCGDCWGGLCVECGCWVAEREKELRSLGIEVD